MSWATDFPEELLRKPTGLVGFTGLDIVNNSTHQCIWEAFSLNRKLDRLPLHFKLEDSMHEYPISKPKRQSYDWYIPKGLLKSGWMTKHLEVIPSLVIFFIDCDWDDPQWKSKLHDCINGIKFLRNQLNGRITKVGLVLIQQNVPLPPGEDITASERAATLCKLCELSIKLLFVLPITESLIGYTLRLEHAFVDFSRAYYNSEARWVKTHNDHLNKTTHALLFVRHQFKIAFYNEFKQDSHTALKHYKQAYIYILELRLLDFNILEIKTIAGFLNYKICKLSFSHSLPFDAISQFRDHVDYFKTKLGIPELNFEHTAWMSKQFQIFGDLFDEAIKQGLAAILTQHPGIYYQQAAHHSANRRSLSQTTCQGVEGELSGSFVATLHKLDYYGQRPWRQGQQSIEPPDLSKEKEGIKMLHLVEKKVNHSKIIIPLLGSAVTHAKRYKSPRMKRHLLVQLMDEYYLSNEYSKALSLVSRATHEYRNERWWMVLTSILSNALKCAYLSADVQQYVTVCLELLGVYSLIKKNEKLRVLKNLNLILKGEIPEAEPALRLTKAVDVDKLWKGVLCSSGGSGSGGGGGSGEKHKIFTIDVANIIPFVECKVQFSREVFQSDSKISIHVYMRSQTVKKVTFHRLSLTLNNETYNKHCTYENSPESSLQNKEEECTESPLTLTQGKLTCVTFSFVPMPSDVGSQLEVTSINLEMGSPNPQKDKPSCSFHLAWRGSSVDTLSPSICCQRNLLPITPTVRKHEETWQNIKLEPYAKISSRKPQIGMDIKCDNPGFVGELVSYKVTIKNKESYPISNVRCNVILDPNVLPVIKNSTILYVNTEEELNERLQKTRQQNQKEMIRKRINHTHENTNKEVDGAGVPSQKIAFQFRNTTDIDTNFITTESQEQNTESSNNYYINDPYFAKAVKRDDNIVGVDTDNPKSFPGKNNNNNVITSEDKTASNTASEISRNNLPTTNDSTNNNIITEANKDGKISHNKVGSLGKGGSDNTGVNNDSQNNFNNTNNSTTNNNNVDDTEYINSDPADDNNVDSNDRYSGTTTDSLKAMNPVMMEMSKSLRVADAISWVFYSHTKYAGDLLMLVSITYDIVTGEGSEQTVSRCVENRVLSVCVVDPVDVMVDLLNLKMEKLLIEKNTPTLVDHCFLLTSSILNNSHTTIQIIHTKFNKNVGVVVDDDEEQESYLRGEELNEAEVATECFCLCSNAFQDQSLSLGSYTVHLIRRSGEHTKENRRNQIFTKTVQLPQVSISSSPLYVDLILPSFGVVHDNLFIFYSIRNMSPAVQELMISMETCEGFMFSGHKQVTVRILPLSNIQLKYNLVPLMPGTLSLPKLNIVNKQHPDFELEHHRQTSLPTTVFIKPQPKILK